MKFFTPFMHPLRTVLFGVALICANCSEPEAVDRDAPKAAKNEHPNKRPPGLEPAEQQGKPSVFDSVSETSLQERAPVDTERRLIEVVFEKNQKLQELEKEDRLVGMKLVDLESFLGKATQQQDQGHTMTWRLDTGYGGLEWKFETQNSTVIKVTKRDLD